MSPDAAPPLPRSGQPAPDVTRASTPGKAVTLAALRGRPVLLAFCRLAFTGIGAAQPCELRDDYDGFPRAGVTVLPIRVDAVATLREFSRSSASRLASSTTSDAGLPAPLAPSSSTATTPTAPAFSPPPASSGEPTSRTSRAAAAGIRRFSPKLQN